MCPREDDHSPHLDVHVVVLATSSLSRLSLITFLPVSVEESSLTVYALSTWDHLSLTPPLGPGGAFVLISVRVRVGLAA